MNRRDIATIDAELRLLAAVRRHVKEHGGPLPPAALVDGLLDERAETAAQPTTCRG